MKRLYYLTEDLDSTQRISADLHEQGITDWNFHVLSKDEAGLYKRHVHSATLVQKVDLIRFAERGGLVGFLVALLATAYIITAEPFGSSVSGLVYVAIFGFITLFGTWVGGLTGLATENQQIAAYHADIEAGKNLLMIDVRAAEEARVQQLLAEKYPEAQYRGSGSIIPNPFRFTFFRADAPAAASACCGEKGHSHH